MLLLIFSSVIFNLPFLACYALKIIACLIFFWFWNMLTGRVSQSILAPFFRCLSGDINEAVVESLFSLVLRPVMVVI